MKLPRPKIVEQPPGYSRSHDLLSAIAYTCAQLNSESRDAPQNYNDITRFLLLQQANLPDYLKLGMALVTSHFDAVGLRYGKLFRHLRPEQRRRQFLAWKHSKVGFRRDFIRYYESLATLALYSRQEFDRAELDACVANPHEQTHPQVIRDPAPVISAEIVVIGSGPGGALTACTLAEAGRNVLLVEEGPFLPLESCPPFSREEMLQKYRNGGQNVALGKNKVAYVEGRCVGGGSEINSGLYHRTPPETLEKWHRDFQVQAISESDLLPHFQQCEKDLSVSLLNTPAPAASLKLHEGASRLGWKSLEVPRWFAADAKAPGGGIRQSMTRTYIPRFLQAGGQLLPNTKAVRLRQDSGKWKIEARNGETAIILEAEHLFLAGGAVQTPALLLRSGIGSNVGNNLQLHPTVKVVARFPEQVNSPQMGVPVHQVKEFAPAISFGCSISSPSYLALGLLEFPDALRQLKNSWQHFANYYAMGSGASSGSVRVLPGFEAPLVRYSIEQTGLRDLSKGLKELCRALLEAGAARLYPGPSGSKEIASLKDLQSLPELLSGTGNLMTIHLFSSCPMGENKARCAVDSFGRVHGHKNLYVSDASLLCSAPGVNPQGSIMAIARRNALAFLDAKHS